MAEVKSTQTEESQCSTDDMSKEAYELMVEETPPSTYWKEVAEERRKALYDTLQENEKKEERITKLECENEELQEIAQHVQDMADKIERLTGKIPGSGNSTQSEDEDSE